MELLKRGDGKPDLIVLPSIIDDRQTGSEKIRCPQCDWRPSPSSAWTCIQGRDDSPEPPFLWCGTTWNTFDTAGKCPGCAHQWTWTSCLQCHQWSLHEDWYETERE
jgi:hypothetical protein